MAKRICLRESEHPAVLSEYPLIFEENVEIPHETLYGASRRGHTISETPFINVEPSLIESETPFRAGEAALSENAHRVTDKINACPGYEDLLSRSESWFSSNEYPVDETERRVILNEYSLPGSETPFYQPDDLLPQRDMTDDGRRHSDCAVDLCDAPAGIFGEMVDVVALSIGYAATCS